MTWAAVQAKPSHAPAFGHDTAALRRCAAGWRHQLLPGRPRCGRL